MMSDTILVLAEQRQGALNPQSIETVVAGQRLARSHGMQLFVGLLGNELDAPAAALAGANANRLLLVEHELLDPYNPDAYCIASRSLVEQFEPRWVLFPHTYQVRDFAPRLAAGFQRALISDCVDLRDDGHETVFVRQMFQGKTNADVATLGDAPHFISFQAGAFRPDELESAGTALHAEKIGVPIDIGQIRVKAEAPVQGTERGVDLSQAEIIVSVGRGIQSAENIEMAQTLAKALGGEVGASRPVCDEGWLPIERQVGSSGQTVAPKLYLALGISGSVQHMVGMKGSRTIVAVNKDPNAPIFKIADYGIVGDLLEVVPALLDALDNK